MSANTILSVEKRDVDFDDIHSFLN